MKKETYSHKDKNIVLIYYNSTDIDFFGCIVKEIEKYLANANYVSIKIDFGMTDWQKDLQNAISERVYFSIGFNSAGIGLCGNGTLLCQLFNYPHISLMTEVPYHFLSKYLTEPGIDNRNNIILHLERIDNLYIKQLQSEKEQFKTHPFFFGGVKSEKSSQDKDIDIIFSGSFAGSPVREWNRQMIPVFVKSILNDTADYMETYASAVPEAVYVIIKSRHLLGTFSMDQLYPYFADLFSYIKAYRRLKCMKYVIDKGLFAHICGNWPDIYHTSGTVHHEVLPYSEIINLYGRSKLIIQDNAGINGGIHERIFSAMLNGAVVISENGSYLNKVFVNGQDIILFDWENMDRIESAVHLLLQKQDLRDKIAMRAYKKADEAHTWAARMDNITEIVENWYEKSIIK